MQKRHVTKTPFGYITEMFDDQANPPTIDGVDFFNFFMDYRDERSLFSRISKNEGELIALHSKEDSSLEDIVSVFHSLIHKVTEGIRTGDHKQARRAYLILQQAIPKFGLPE